jgi:predicted RNA-binding protein with PIN domain
MGFLIDGNNLNFALVDAEGRPVSRGRLCQMLGPLLAAGEWVCVVFDGPPPQAARAAQIAGQVHVQYAAPQSADRVLLRLIRDDTAPRRLTVVSSDREIRQAARRRRCQGVTSEQFASFVHRLNCRTRPAGIEEPAEKTCGLSPRQLDHWLKEFQVEPPAEDEDEL